MLRVVLASLLLCMSCAVDDLTEVVVIIETEAAVRAQSTSLALSVTTVPGPNGGLADTLLDNSNAPWRDGRFTVALSPKKAGLDSRYRVEASAQVNGRTIATARLISGFVAGQTRYVRLLLEDQCLGVLSCTPDTTCHQGACVGAEVDPTRFAPSSDLAPSSNTLPATADVLPVDAAVSAKPDAALPAAGDTTPPSDASVVRPVATDAATAGGPPRSTDAATATTPDAGARNDAAVTPSRPDAGGSPADAGTPVPTVSPTPGTACKPGYYVGSFNGDYAYTLFNSKTDTKIEPLSTNDAPVLSFVLTADADTVGGPSQLRISAGCMSGTMMAPPSNRPFFARMAGVLDCTTGKLTGRLAGLYFLLNNTDIDYTFTGALSAQLDASKTTLQNGAWDAVEPKDPNNFSSGGGAGTWTASFVSDAAPSVTMDPCVDVVATP